MILFRLYRKLRMYRAWGFGPRLALRRVWRRRHA